MPLLPAHFVSFGYSRLPHLLWGNQFFQPQLYDFYRLPTTAVQTVTTGVCLHTEEARFLPGEGLKQEEASLKPGGWIWSSGQPACSHKVKCQCAKNQEAEEQAVSKAIKTLLWTPTFNNRVLGFDCQLCCQFQVPANMHTAKQQVMGQAVGALTSTWEALTEFLTPGFSLVQSWLLQACGE